MIGMARYPDKYFDLAIVDPPYGQFNDDKRGHQGGGHAKRYKYGKWDIAPDKGYFEELFRVSRNQIIWGGNYFNLPPTRCFAIWRKLTISENFTMAMCEYAWTSLNENAKWFEHAPQNSERFHPTQKPIALYDWLIQHYAKDCKTILDTHVGSGSSRIAASKADMDFTGFEIDQEYWEAQENRFQRFIAQGRLF